MVILHWKFFPHGCTGSKLFPWQYLCEFPLIVAKTVDWQVGRRRQLKGQLHWYSPTGDIRHFTLTGIFGGNIREVELARCVNVTRGQWPYRPAATGAMTNRHVMLYGIKWPRSSYDLRFEISNLEYPGIHVHIAFNGIQDHGGLQTTSEVI